MWCIRYSTLFSNHFRWIIRRLFLTEKFSFRYYSNANAHIKYVRSKSDEVSRDVISKALYYSEITLEHTWSMDKKTFVVLVRKRTIPTASVVLWSSGQSSWLQIQRSRVRFPALLDFLRSSGSGTRFTQPREYNWGATWKK
jgi:hypothetical protein